MPFLIYPDTTDVLALRAMNSLAAEGALSTLTDHPLYQDGITEDETTLIAAVGTLDHAPEEIQRVLESGVAAIETVAWGTELTPDLNISIVRTGSQSRPGTIEATRALVEFVETRWGLPLPVDHVVIMLNEKAVTDKYAGANFGFAFSYLPKYEQRQGTPEWQDIQQGFVHEVAHYYWTGLEGWIGEGLANMVEYMFGRENGLSRGQLHPSAVTARLTTLRCFRVEPTSSDWQRYECTYYLGQLFFQELLETMGEEAFGEKLREFYHLSLEERQAEQVPGIAEVRQVFSEQAAIIDRHWSGTLNAPDNLPYDAGIDLTNHDLIQWDQYPTYDGRSVTFKGTLIDEAILENNRPDLGGVQNFTLFSVDEFKHLGSILSPRTDGARWVLSNTGSVVANTYWIYQADGTFHVEFSFPTVLGNPSDYAITVWGFQDASQTPTISENADTLGYARIRIP